MATESPNSVTPAYVSFKTFLNMLDRLSDSGIPQKIDRTYWGYFLNGSTGQQTMGALRFLGLVNGDGVPFDELAKVVDPETRRQALNEILLTRYADAMAIAEPSRATLGQLRSAFHTAYKAENETLRKSITFFTQAAQYVGLPLSTMIVNSLKGRSSGSSSSTTRRTQPKRERRNGADSTDGTPHAPRRRTTSQTQNVPPSAAPAMKVVTLRNGETLTLSLDGNFLTIDPNDRVFLNDLIDFIEAHERGETQNQRSQQANSSRYKGAPADEDVPDDEDDSELSADDVPF